MKPKTIKSNQVACEAPTVECTCGEICVNKDYGSHLVTIYQELVCEACGQEWDFPSDVILKVVFTKRRRGN